VVDAPRAGRRQPGGPRRRGRLLAVGVALTMVAALVPRALADGDATTSGGASEAGTPETPAFETGTFEGGTPEAGASWTGTPAAPVAAGTGGDGGSLLVASTEGGEGDGSGSLAAAGDDPRRTPVPPVMAEDHQQGDRQGTAAAGGQAMVMQDRGDQAREDAQDEAEVPRPDPAACAGAGCPGRPPVPGTVTAEGVGGPSGGVFGGSPDDPRPFDEQLADLQELLDVVEDFVQEDQEYRQLLEQEGREYTGPLDESWTWLAPALKAHILQAIRQLETDAPEDSDRRRRLERFRAAAERVLGNVPDQSPMSITEPFLPTAPGRLTAGREPVGGHTSPTAHGSAPGLALPPQQAPRGEPVAAGPPALKPPVPEPDIPPLKADAGERLGWHVLLWAGGAAVVGAALLLPVRVLCGLACAKLVPVGVRMPTDPTIG